MTKDTTRSSDLLCLFCGDILCKEHAIKHHQNEDHKVYYNMVNQYGICYECGQKELEPGSKYQILTDINGFFVTSKQSRSSIEGSL